MFIYLQAVQHIRGLVLKICDHSSNLMRRYVGRQQKCALDALWMSADHAECPRILQEQSNFLERNTDKEKVLELCFLNATICSLLP